MGIEGVSRSVHTMGGLEAQGGMSRLLDKFLGASDATVSEANPDEAGEARIFVSDRDEGT